MNYPPYLKKGDKIAILCPASYIKDDLTKAYNILKEWGLKLVIYPSVSAQHHQFAGTDELRSQDLQEALDNPEIKAIITGRGGYGTVRLIDRLDFSTFKKNPKWLVGFSDITVLHSHVHKQLQIPTIHGQMVNSFLDGTAASINSLKNALFGEATDLQYQTTNTYNRLGTAEGTLVGGNLSILHSLVGSASDINYDHKILFLEDVCESYYNIDRMLWTLKRAGKLTHLRGLIIGGFTELRDSDPIFGQEVEQIILDKVREFDFPIAFGCPAGHIQDNNALIFGYNIKLTITENETQIKYLS